MLTAILILASMIGNYGCLYPSVRRGTHVSAINRVATPTRNPCSSLSTCARSYCRYTENMQYLWSGWRRIHAGGIALKVYRRQHRQWAWQAGNSGRVCMLATTPTDYRANCSSESLIILLVLLMSFVDYTIWFLIPITLIWYHSIFILHYVHHTDVRSRDNTHECDNIENLYSARFELIVTAIWVDQRFTSQSIVNTSCIAACSSHRVFISG